MPRIFSIKGHYYAGKWRKPGDGYQASPTDALIMKALKNASDAPPDDVVPSSHDAPPVAVVPPAAPAIPPSFAEAFVALADAVLPVEKPADDEGGQPQDTPPAVETPPADDDAEAAAAELAALKAEYKAKFGNLPHWKLSAEKIRAAIDAE